jgi:class 3 adenylate cyclase
MHRLTLRFTDADLEAVFAEEQARKALKPFRAAMICFAVVVLILWLLLDDLLPQIPDAKARLYIPMLVMLAIMTYGYARSYMRSFLRMHQLIVLAGALGFAAVAVGICSLMPRTSLDSVGLALVIVHTLNVYSIVRLRFLGACYAGWGMAAMYLGYLGYAGALDGTNIVRHASVLMLANLCGMIAAYQMDQSARREFLAMRMLGEERERSERLLLNILPASIAERLKSSEAAIADHSEEVTVLFADIVGFTPLSARKTPQALVQMLDRIFTEFDTLAEAHGLEKIKTIGDAYMAAAGLPERRADHAPAAARMAQGMLEAVARIAGETGEALALRIGLHSGPVVAGVIGTKKFSYDMWGDTVNTASRMESHGVPGAVHCSEATAALLQAGFALTARGGIEVEGKGEMHTFLLMPTYNDTHSIKGAEL